MIDIYTSAMYGEKISMAMANGSRYHPTEVASQ